MSETTTNGDQTGHNPLLEAVRKVLLAAIGAVALAQDELEDFVNKLVERGEIAEQEGKALIRDLKEKRKKQQKSVEQDLDARIGAFLTRTNTITREDVEELSAKIAELNDKLDELQED